MKQINYNHLYYFYMVARSGGIARAAEVLNVTPQTVSGQIAAMEYYFGVSLFRRSGKRLQLNEAGQMAYDYAEDIFGLGSELATVLSTRQERRQITVTVGVIDVIPKSLAFMLLKNSLQNDIAIKLIGREGDFEYLCAEMALNRVDLIISDRGLPSTVSVRAYSHPLGESGFTFFAEAKLARRLRRHFPASLEAQPFILPGDKSVQKHNILSWFEARKLQPAIVAEFDDSALLKLFGREGLGVFCAPSIIEESVRAHYKVEVVGRADDLKERYYGISPERRIKHPAVEKLFAEARKVMASF